MTFNIKKSCASELRPSDYSKQCYQELLSNSIIPNSRYLLLRFQIGTKKVNAHLNHNPSLDRIRSKDPIFHSRCSFIQSNRVKSLFLQNLQVEKRDIIIALFSRVISVVRLTGKVRLLCFQPHHHFVLLLLPYFPKFSFSINEHRSMKRVKRMRNTCAGMISP